MKADRFFDADAVNIIVRYRSLADIDREILQEAITCGDRSLSPSIKAWHVDLYETLRLARDVAEYCFLNDLPTNESTDTKRELGLWREKRLQGLIRTQKETQDQVQGLTKALANHMAEKPKKQIPKTQYTKIK